MKIYEIIEQGYEVLGEKMKRKLSEKEIQDMIEKYNMLTLNYFIEYVCFFVYLVIDF